jgi:hypothetical protein
MHYSYVASDNTAGDAQKLGDAGRDVYVKKVIFGAPTATKAIKLYNKAVAYGHAGGMASVDNTNVALWFVQPTAAAGDNVTYVLDLAGPENPGLPLDGGSFHTDDDKVTVVWEYKNEPR